MPREPWRDHLDYVSLWRLARQRPDDPTPRFLLADWLEEQGQPGEACRERLHGLLEQAPQYDPDTHLVLAHLVPMGKGAWRRLLGSPPAEDVVCVFDRDVHAYQYLKQYRGRCGWDVGMCDWSSETELGHLLAVPRLEMLACELVSAENWDWTMNHLRGLVHFEANGPMIDPPRLADLKRLPRLRGLVLRGNVTRDTRAIPILPGLRHLSIGPYWLHADYLAAIAPEVESLHADPGDIGTTIWWPRLRSLQMLSGSGGLALSNPEVLTLARHTQLERLNVRCEKVTAPAIKALAGLPQLRELVLRFTGPRVPSLKGLVKAPAIESLTIEGPMPEERIQEVVNISGLRSLSLSNLAGGRGVAALAGMSNLEELTLGGETEDTASVPALAALPRLAKLDVQHLKMPPETAVAAKVACPPWLECNAPAQAK
jgi:uncharacterized protein (TIGR02996 family)